MNKMELLAKLEEARILALNTEEQFGDPESAHCDADEALLEFINDADIRAAWEAIDPKWFA